MSQQPAAAVVGAAVLLPHYASINDLVAGNRSEDVAPGGELLDRRTRRRASALVKAFADVVGTSLDISGLDPSTVATVFGSALGEVDTMVGILDQLWEQREAPSPMAFAMSVHNAASGSVSISTKNREFTTSLAADFDTPAMALMEGLSVLKRHDTPVIVTCADESSPDKLVDPNTGWAFAAAALALVPEHMAPADAPRISIPYIGDGDGKPADVGGRAARNPSIGLVDLAHAVQRREPGSIRLDRGRGNGWTVDVFRSP